MRNATASTGQTNQKETPTLESDGLEYYDAKEFQQSNTEKLEEKHNLNRRFHDSEEPHEEQPRDYINILSESRYYKRTLKDDRKMYASSVANGVYGRERKQDPLTYEKCKPSLDWSLGRTTNNETACANVNMETKVQSLKPNADSLTTITNVCQPYIRQNITEIKLPSPSLSQLSSLPPCVKSSSYSAIEEQFAIVPEFSGVKQTWAELAMENASSGLASGLSSGASSGLASGVSSVVNSALLVPMCLKDAVVTVDVPFTNKSVDLLGSNSAEMALNESIRILLNAGSIDAIRLAIAGVQMAITHHLPPKAQRAANILLSGLTVASGLIMGTAAITTSAVSMVASSNVSSFALESVKDAVKVATAAYSKYMYQNESDKNITGDEYELHISDQKRVGSLRHRVTKSSKKDEEKCEEKFEEKEAEIGKRIKARRACVKFNDVVKIRKECVEINEKSMTENASVNSNVKDEENTGIDITITNSDSQTNLEDKSTSGELGKAEICNQNQRTVQSVAQNTAGALFFGNAGKEMQKRTIKPLAKSAINYIL